MEFQPLHWRHVEHHAIATRFLAQIESNSRASDGLACHEFGRSDCDGHAQLRIDDRPVRAGDTLADPLQRPVCVLQRRSDQYYQEFLSPVAAEPVSYANGLKGPPGEKLQGAIATGWDPGASGSICQLAFLFTILLPRCDQGRVRGTLAKRRLADIVDF